MKTLIVEDDFTSRVLLQELLHGYGSCHVAVNGKEAVEAIAASHQDKEPYDLICLDIMMPEMDGQEALKQIRAVEQGRRIDANHQVKVVMTTALADPKNVDQAFYSLCDGYLVKPLNAMHLVKTLRGLKLIQ